jgi:DNA invertase Pin-like site-specific DNA recombinase
MSRLRIGAAQYLRASTNLQDLSTPRQAEAIADYAKRGSYRIVATYNDEATSGLTLKARPAMQDLLRAALAPKRLFDAILVFDISRWGRFQDIDEGSHYEFLCRQAGVQVIYCTEAFQNDRSIEAELYKQFKRAAAAEFSRELSERTRHAQRFTARRGLLAAGFAPFGYERAIVDKQGRVRGRIARGDGCAPVGVRTRLEPGPAEEVAAVRRIFHLFTARALTLDQIAETLNAEKAPHPRKSWSRLSVRAVLRNETHVGVYSYGRRERPLGGNERLAPPQNVLRLENAWAPIISKRVFSVAQARLAELARPSTERLRDDLVRLLARHGTLTTALIDAAPDTLPSITYSKRFGGIGAVYTAAGYCPLKRRGLRRESMA